MPATYEPIASQTLGSAAASVTFDNIAATWTDLRLVISAKSANASHTELYLRYNGDTGNNYSSTRLYGNGTSAVSDRRSGTNQTNRIDAGFLPPSTSNNGTSLVDVFSYASTNVNKTALMSWESQGGVSGNQFVVRQVGLWRSTAAITSITLVFDSGNIASGCTFSLYGIKAA